MLSWFTEQNHAPNTIEIQFSEETLFRLLEQEQISICEIKVLNRKSKRCIRNILMNVVRNKIN